MEWGKRHYGFSKISLQFYFDDTGILLYWLYILAVGNTDFLSLLEGTMFDMADHLLLLGNLESDIGVGDTGMEPTILQTPSSNLSGCSSDGRAASWRKVPKIEGRFQTWIKRKDGVYNDMNKSIHIHYLWSIFLTGTQRGLHRICQYNQQGGTSNKQCNTFNLWFPQQSDRIR